MTGTTVTEAEQPGTGRRRSLFDTSRLAAVGLVTITAATIVYLGFNAGGFFPLAPAIAGLVVTQLLILRVLLAEDPFAGVSAPFAVAVVAMCAYCLWTLASGLWSHAGGEALIEFDRAFLYLLVLVVVGSLGR